MPKIFIGQAVIIESLEDEAIVCEIIPFDDTELISCYVPAQNKYIFCDIRLVKEHRSLSLEEYQDLTKKWRTCNDCKHYSKARGNFGMRECALLGSMDCNQRYRHPDFTAAVCTEYERKIHENY